MSPRRIWSSSARARSTGALREAAAPLGARAHLLGEVVDGAAELLAGLDVYAQPSRREGRSVAMLEAMAAALPTVAHRLPAVSELHPDGTTAVLVPPEDVDALGEALLGLVRDPERRRALGEAARARVAAFSMDAMVEAYVRLWRASVPVRMTRVVHVRSAQGLYGAERSLLVLASATEPPLEPRVASLVRPGREDALGAAAGRLGIPAVRVEARGSSRRRRSGRWSASRVAASFTPTTTSRSCLRWPPAPWRGPRWSPPSTATRLT